MPSLAAKPVIDVCCLWAGNVWMLSFEVKFYPADPAQLQEEQTR